MRAFITLNGIAATLPLANVDTDKILPASFLKTTTREGLGAALFASLRYEADGSEKKEFVLNRDPWRAASILIAHENFGCGSSREHAPWALLDFGIRCIVAPSFADIFHSNCFKNGILPVTLPREQIDQLMDAAADPATAKLSIDLPAQMITLSDGDVIGFSVDHERKAALLQGRDDVARSLDHTPRIAAFEADGAARAPWVYIGIADRVAAALAGRHSKTGE